MAVRYRVLCDVRWRPGHIALLIFQGLWLNVILPGHTRGLVTLPGSTVQNKAGDDCGSCCTPNPETSQDESQSDENRAARCAVCFFAMRVTPPPVVDLRPPAMALLGIDAPPSPATFVSHEHRLTYLGRAPPAI